MLEISPSSSSVGWLLGMVSSHPLGGFVRVLLVIVMVLLRLIRGKPGV